LRAENVHPEACSFRLVAFGPILGEAAELDEHRLRRDQIGAMEKALAAAMASAGYKVLNTVNCRIPLDEEEFVHVKREFACHFPKLASTS
jgi:hypothetical protein